MLKRFANLAVSTSVVLLLVVGACSSDDGEDGKSSAASRAGDAGASLGGDAGDTNEASKTGRSSGGADAGTGSSGGKSKGADADPASVDGVDGVDAVEADAGSSEASASGDAVVAALSKSFKLLAQVYCDKLLECTAFGFERSYASVDECRDRRQLLYSFWAGLPDTGWTPSGVEDCAKAVEIFSCREFVDDNLLDTCNPKGKRRQGEACNAREQCESRYCATEGFGCGTCEVAPDEGSSCQQDNDCPDKTACLCDNGTPRCSAPRCRRLRDAEEACSAKQPCGAGLNCLEGRCEPAPAQEGAECDPVVGLHCDTVSAGLVCTEAGCTQLRAAEVCSPTEYCQDRDTTCELSPDSFTAQCVPLPGDTGECDVEAGRSCRFPALCVGGQCELPGAAKSCK